ncbi:reductive dehalogenase [Chloroflexota bacterium]
MENKLEFGNILHSDKQLGPFPIHRIKKVNEPTTLVTDNIQRVDARENAFRKAIRGDYGPAIQREAPRSQTKYPLSATLTEMRQFVGAIEPNEVAEEIAPIPEDPAVLTRHIKRLGYFLKADIIGVCRLPESAVYSHDSQGNPIDLNYANAIVIVMGKEYRTLDASNGSDWVTMPLSYDLYLRLAVISQTMANYIRRLGYQASAEHTGKTPGGPRVLFPPLLLWSGIGEVSRAGIILNPFLGMNFKAAVVLTDMPLVLDRPVKFGLQDFCQHCQICAEFCPSSAIPTGDKTMYNGYQTWKLNEQRCHSFRVLNKQGTFCGRCVKVCPWTKPNTWPHNMVRWTVKSTSLARRIATKASKILGPDKVSYDDKWWFDLEEVDGRVIIPKV